MLYRYQYYIILSSELQTCEAKFLQNNPDPEYRHIPKGSQRLCARRQDVTRGPGVSNKCEHLGLQPGITIPKQKICNNTGNLDSRNNRNKIHFGPGIPPGDTNGRLYPPSVLTTRLSNNVNSATPSSAR